MVQSIGSPASSTTTAAAVIDARREQPAISLETTAKPQRACDPCRRAKVRCMPAPGNAEAATCLRCMKSNRTCIISPPAGRRKKRKKTINKVTELEKKIDLLTASLQVREAGLSLHERPGASSTAELTQHLTDQSSKESEDDDTTAMMDVGDDTITMPRTSSASDSTLHSPPDIDIVSRGLISADDAEKLFARYNTHMARHMPAVVFPGNISAAELRRTRPMVFFAIMTAAAYDTPVLQRRLVRELAQLLAHKIVVAAEKSLELIQALQISVLWYWPPEHYEDLQIYQLGQMSITMAIDISLGRARPEKKPYARHAFRRKECSHNTVDLNPLSLEARRAWLTCYYLASNMTVTMQRPMILTWTGFMTESCEILRSSPDRAPTDDYFCTLVWAHRLCEDAAQQIAGDHVRDPANASRLVFSLRKVEQDLTQLRDSLSNEFIQETLNITIACLPLYMHGAVLDSDTAEDKQKEPIQPLSTPNAGTVLPDAIALSASDIRTVSHCLHNARVVTETFLCMDAESIQTLPTFTFGRVIIASAMLFRIYVFVNQNPSLSAVVDKHELAVGSCIDRLIRQFHAAAANRRCRPAARFLAVLIVIKDNFFKYCEHQCLSKEMGSGAKTLDASQSASFNVSSSMEQAPLPPQHQQPQQADISIPQVRDSGDGVRLTLTNMTSVPLSSGPESNLMLPYDINLFAQTAEELAYSFNFTNDNDYFTEYQGKGDFGMAPDMTAGYNRFGDVDLTTYPP